MPFDGTRLSQNASSDLIAAKQLILDRGWQKEAGVNGSPHCPVTALPCAWRA